MRDVLASQVAAYETVIECIERQHGGELAAQVDALLCRIAAFDEVLTSNVLKHHGNLLLLRSGDWSWFLPGVLDLERNSAFVAAYLIEQIPVIQQHLDLQAFMAFLLAIKDQSARGLSYLIGTADSQMCDDLASILEAVGADYYQAVMACVLRNRDALEASCAPLLIHVKNYHAFVPVDALEQLLDLVCRVRARFAGFGVVALLENAEQVFARHSLQAVVDCLSRLPQGNADYFHYLVVNGLPPTDSVRGAAPGIEQLEGVTLDSHVDAPDVFDGKLISAIIANIKYIDAKTLDNMRHQLSIPDFPAWFAQEPRFNTARMQLDDAYAGAWFETFDYWGGALGIAHFRTVLGDAIEAAYDKPGRQRLVQGNKALFNRQAEYGFDRLQAMIDVAFPGGDEAAALPGHLSAIRDWIDDHDRDRLRDRLSTQRMVIGSWHRDPWQDYSRSDEFFSCTGIGDYAVDNAPGYLLEPNLHRLFAWYQGRRIGRINLLAVADLDGKPGLLLDAVEGGGRLLQSEERVSDVLGGVAAFARRCGLDSYYINCKATYNTVPKQFIAHATRLCGQPIAHRYLRRYYQGTETYQAMPHAKMPFFEAFGNTRHGIVGSLKILLH